MIKFLTPLLTTLVLTGCGDGATQLLVENRSAARLESVAARGSGFEAYIGALEPGQVSEVSIYPQGESGLSLSFTANGKTFHSPAAGYFESGGAYSVTTVVSKDLSVSVKGGTSLF